MRELREVYESARTSIPLQLFPARDTVPPWEDLHDSVHAELAELNDHVLSVPKQETRLLLSYQRVINEFNKGVRRGYLASTGQESDSHRDLSGKAPFRAGLLVGNRARSSLNPDMGLVRQFITATHLFDYEFGQLHQALQSPFEFLLNNLSPERSAELGDLAIALPMLLRHQRPILDRIVGEAGFSFSRYYMDAGSAPTHLGYLTIGCVAMFDPDPLSWQRVAACLGLASRPFENGRTLQAEDHLAPEHAALTVLDKPIAACRAVRQQMERIELARKWVAVLEPSFDMDESEDGPTTLWDMYQMTSAAHIRGGDDHFSDLVTSIVARTVSDHFEETIPAEQTRLAFFRKHFLSFLRGFDARHEGVVDASALGSVGLGRNLSQGFRRFKGGGLLIGAISRGLAEIVQTLNAVHFASMQPTAFVIDQLHEVGESAVSDALLELFNAHPALLEDLFGGTGRFEFYSRTQIQVFSPYDLLRSVLFHTLRSVGHDVLTEDERMSLRETAVEQLAKLKNFTSATPSANTPAMDPNLVRRIMKDSEKVLEVGCVLADDYDTLVRLMRHLWVPVYMARVLAKPQTDSRDRWAASLQPDGRTGT